MIWDLTIHMTYSLQGMQNLRKLVGNERIVLSRRRMGSHVETTGTFNLTLNNGFVLKLENTFNVPSFSRNIISIS